MSGYKQCEALATGDVFVLGARATDVFGRQSERSTSFVVIDVEAPQISLFAPIAAFEQQNGVDLPWCRAHWS
ncbi:MAG: hypothetical protein R2873_04165 [Caldilineaceae bacterium]